MKYSLKKWTLKKGPCILFALLEAERCEYKKKIILKKAMKNIDIDLDDNEKDFVTKSNKGITQSLNKNGYKRVSREELTVGDIIVFCRIIEGVRYYNHVALYLGCRKYVHLTSRKGPTFGRLKKRNWYHVYRK